MARDLYKYFRIEAREIVEQLSRGVLAFEQGASAQGDVAMLLRLAHTLKGAAHVVKQARIAQLAHEFEDALAPFSNGQMMRGEHARAMLRQIDEINGCLAGLERERSSRDKPEIASDSVSAPTSVDEVFDTVRVDIGDMDILLNGISEASLQVAGLKAKLAAMEQAADLGSVLLNQLAPRRVNDSPERSNDSWNKARVLAEDLTGLLKPLRRTLVAGIEQVESELAQVRDTASQVRLIPVSAVFGTMRRAIRNSAEALGKEVEFETSGGEHRLDAHVLAAVRDALLHVVRNAVAHGIESRAERIATNKSPTGKITLQVQRHGSRVAFSCHDDGNGFDVVALRRAIVSSGIRSESDAEPMDVEDLLLAIVGGGISTSRTVTEISGRGIGLDVVRQAAAKLKAEVAIETTPGQGSTVRISVPVSLLSLAAVIVDSNGVSASLPLDAVRQTLRIPDSEIVHNPDGDAIVFDGRTIPFLPLPKALGQEVRRKRDRSTFSSAVVVRSGTDIAAIGVDRLLGTATVLLRAIPSFAVVDPIIAGAALDAEGNPQLVLDPAALVLAARANRSDAHRQAPRRARVVLVVDDSLTTRMLEKSILESAGYEVDLATSAEEALEKGLARKYDLFVVDVEMPGMSGFEFVAKTREYAALSSVPSILVTSRSSKEDKKRGEEAGARAYIVKSEFDQGQLLQLIRQLVS
ncbi:MAG TPA: response regulator [Candidatus Saccharimonadales bacterium]|nr:response regulator [Candidatus Saccharimonadales bacterium]